MNEQADKWREQAGGWITKAEEHEQEAERLRKLAQMVFDRIDNKRWDDWKMLSQLVDQKVAEAKAKEAGRRLTAEVLVE